MLMRRISAQTITMPLKISQCIPRIIQRKITRSGGWGALRNNTQAKWRRGEAVGATHPGDEPKRSSYPKGRDHSLQMFAWSHLVSRFICSCMMQFAGAWHTGWSHLWPCYPGAVNTQFVPLSAFLKGAALTQAQKPAHVSPRLQPIYLLTQFLFFWTNFSQFVKSEFLMLAFKLIHLQI